MGDPHVPRPTHPAGQPVEGPQPASLARALGAAEAEERRQATSELARLPIGDALPLLLRALGDEDWRVRKEASITARGFGPARPLIAELVRSLRDATDVGLRNAAVEVLAAAGAAAMALVAEALPSLDADGRKLAVEALGRSGVVAALVPLEAALDDADGNVRAAAVEAIAGLGAVASDQVAAILLRRLASSDWDRSPVLLVAALEGLTAMGVAAPWSVIAPILAQPTLRASALAAAGRSASPEAARAVAMILIESSASATGNPARGIPPGSAVFDRAVRALGELASPENLELVAVVRDALAGAAPELGARLLAAARPSPDTGHTSEPGSVGFAWPMPVSVEDEVTRRRSMALRLASLIGVPGLVDLAVEALGEDAIALEAHRAIVTASAARASHDAGIPSVLEAVSKRLADPNVTPETRGVLVDIVVDMMVAAPAEEAPQVQMASAALRRVARDPEWQVAVRALRALSRVGAEDDLALLAEETLASSRVVAAAAEGALLALAERYPVAARALVARLSTDAAGALPAAILIGGSAAGSEFDERDTTFLAHAATAGDPRARRAAVEAVAALRIAAGPVYAGAVEVLGFALTDEEHVVQITAARALGRLCSAPDAPRASDVLELVDRSGAADLVAAAVRAIGEGMVPAGGTPSARRIGAPMPPADLVAALSLFARGAPSQVALAAVDALAAAHRSGAPAAIPALAAAVDHPDEAVARAAILKIAAQGSPFDAGATAAGLARGLAHGSPSLRSLAVEALGEHGSSAARAELLRRLATEPDTQVAEAIRRALARAGDGAG